jgi:hypothetical protein
LESADIARGSGTTVEDGTLQSDIATGTPFGTGSIPLKSGLSNSIPSQWGYRP